VFDSGVGGLTVLHELLVQLPHEDYLYLGDTARFPYGERTTEELEGFTLAIAEELLARAPKLLVVACNTATAAALPGAAGADDADHARRRRHRGRPPRGGAGR
jgi:glutamate racemase